MMWEANYASVNKVIILTNPLVLQNALMVLIRMLWFAILVQLSALVVT